MRIWELVAASVFSESGNSVPTSSDACVMRFPARDGGCKGAAGDSMFFIVAGEVEVRIKDRTKTLRGGDWRDWCCSTAHAFG